MLKARLFIAGISMASMVLEPVAFGQTQANWAVDQMKQFVKDNQKLGKTLTVKEFWEKNKTKLSPEWQRKFWPGIELQKDEHIPQMDMIMVKGPNGQDTARLLITLDNQKTVSIEVLGSESKMARINGQMISYEDLYNGTGLMEKLAQDSAVKSEVQRTKNLALNSSMLPTYSLFKRMTPRQKAEYLVNMRLVLQAAEDVNKEAFEKSDLKKSAAAFVNLFLEEAFAGAADDPKTWGNDRCIVAGYVGNYVETKQTGHVVDRYCDSSKAIENFKAYGMMNDVAQKSAATYDSSSCSGGQIRCNPLIYGYERQGGGSLCFSADRKSTEFAHATVNCDKASPLNKASLVKDTEAMIRTLLEKEKKKPDEFFKDGKVVSEAKYNELRDSVLKDFNSYIDQALSVCSDAGNRGAAKTKHGETYQAEACNSLEARKLAFTEGFAALKGEYATPTPTPPLPAPVAGGACKKADDECELLATKDKKGHCNSDLKCVPVLAPLPVALAEKKCNENEVLTTEADGSVKCEQVAGALNVKSPVNPKAASTDSWCGKVCVGLIVGLAAFGITWALTKPHKPSGSSSYIPPVAGPLPAPPPQPTPVTPVIPISPSLPVPTPSTGSGSETPPIATPSPATGANGSTR
jgi:hypothetical protein